MQNSYKGSKTWDYDDARRGQRECAVCKFKEYSTGEILVGFMREEDVYPIFNPEDTRVVGSFSLSLLEPTTSLDSETIQRIKNEWLPVEEILEAFLDKRVFDYLD